jgi:hypothetical protein
MLAARLDSSTVVGFDYAVTDHTGSFEVRVYRSGDATLDAGDVFVADTTVAASGSGTGSGTVDLGEEMPLDPARNYVLVVADPGGAIGETDEANNTASFRKLTLGAIAHGFTLTGTPPAWLSPMATALRLQGYETVIPFVWTPLSQLPIPGGSIIAGNALAVQVRAAAAGMATQPNDVVDLHLIGHSRGTAVISQTFRSLELNPGPQSLQLGFYQGTFLDPHVARNSGSLLAGLAELSTRSGTSTVGDFSYDPGRLTARLFAAGTLAFQAGANDPPAYFSANVDRAEMYYQRIAWNQTLPGSAERLTGVNFLSPLPADVEAASAPGTSIIATNVGQFGIGHYEVPLWYLGNVVL